MSRHVCIHGHFYQPPRDDPWSGVVPRQPSAAPYHDWNQRISDECYAPNAAAPILDADGRVARRVNNYARMSFDFGPTLLAWLERHRAKVYAAVLEADRQSRRRFSGHGSALAQGYHHAILPLAHPRDRRTEVLWGVADFRHRFGRAPEGLWLPETAVDVASLEELARAGVRFTVLEPHQALRWREPGGAWQQPTVPGELDSGEPYLCRLPSGRSLALFFYDGPVSRAVAFDRLLDDGVRYAARLVERLGEPTGAPRLLTVATDGESYGHHHRHGEMALAVALSELEGCRGVTLTNLGEHLERHPPRRRVEVREGSAWSCPHALGRWSADCGCGGARGAHQRWRRPLRDTLNWLRGELEGPWEGAAGELLADPWAARDAAVALLLDPSEAARDAFLTAHAARPLAAAERRRAAALLELQRNALRMFTSCGWFFEDVARIETAQVLRYAGRALDLAGELLGLHLEPAFLDRLAAARGSHPHLEDAAAVYAHHVGRVGREAVR